MNEKLLKPFLWLKLPLSLKLSLRLQWLNNQRTNPFSSQSRFLIHFRHPLSTHAHVQMLHESHSPALLHILNCLLSQKSRNPRRRAYSSSQSDGKEKLFRASKLVLCGLKHRQTHTQTHQQTCLHPNVDLTSATLLNQIECNLIFFIHLSSPLFPLSRLVVWSRKVSLVNRSFQWLNPRRVKFQRKRFDFHFSLIFKVSFIWIQFSERKIFSREIVHTF